MYRYRGGKLEKLDEVSQENVVPTTDGTYSFEVPEQEDGLVITHSGAVVATVDEYSGFITPSGLPGTSLRVLPSNNANTSSIYPEILIGYGSQDIFRQFIQVVFGNVFV